LGKVWMKTDRYRRVYGAETRTGYTFECRHNLCLAQVFEQDVRHLRKPRGCCGNRRKQFDMASQAEVDRWNT